MTSSLHLKQFSVSMIGSVRGPISKGHQNPRGTRTTAMHSLLIDKNIFRNFGNELRQFSEKRGWNWLCYLLNFFPKVLFKVQNRVQHFVKRLQYLFYVICEWTTQRWMEKPRKCSLLLLCSHIWSLEMLFGHHISERTGCCCVDRRCCETNDKNRPRSQRSWLQWETGAHDRAKYEVPYWLCACWNHSLKRKFSVYVPWPMITTNHDHSFFLIGSCILCSALWLFWIVYVS